MAYDPEIWQGLREMSPGICQHHQKKGWHNHHSKQPKKGDGFPTPLQILMRPRGDSSIGGLTFENKGCLDFLDIYIYIPGTPEDQKFRVQY